MWRDSLTQRRAGSCSLPEGAEEPIGRPGIHGLTAARWAEVSDAQKELECRGPKTKPALTVFEYEVIQRLFRKDSVSGGEPMNPNPGEPLEHGQGQRKDSVSERGPSSLRVDFATMVEREEEKAKKKKAEIAKAKGTRLRILGACLLALALVLGILYIQSGGLAPGVKLSPTGKQLMGIAALYRGYGAAFGKPPPDMRALKAWGEKLDKQKLAHFEIDNIETLFVSERDGQPFVLVHLTRGLGPVLAHEAIGAHGKRFVVISVGSVEELDEARFQQAIETNRIIANGPKGH